MVFKCMNCEQYLRGNEEECPYCGSKNILLIQERGIKCPNCNAEVALSQIKGGLCPYCGKRILL